MGTPSSTTTPAPHAPRPRPAAWKRLVAAQESGLVLVIALMMLALSIYGERHTKAKPFRVDVPAGAQVTRDADFFKVGAGGREEWYARESGWALEDAKPGTRYVRFEQQSRVEERRAVPGDAVIEDGADAIRVRGSGIDGVFDTGDGWSLGTGDDGGKELQRRVRVRVEAASITVVSGGSVVERGGQVEVRAPDRTVHLPSSTGFRYIEESDTTRYLIGSMTANRFFEKENLVLLTTKASYFAVIAVGMTAIIVLAGVDLSVGSIYAVAAILGAMALQRLGTSASVWASVPLGLVVCMAVGATLGFANGAMITGLRLHPFIITLGTMAIYRGCVLLLTGGETVSELPESVQRGFFKAEVGGVYPTLTCIMIFVAIVGTFILQKTVLGRRIYAIGGNEVAAYYAGIPVGRVKLIVYTLGGMLAGLSACMEVGYNATASVGAGQGYELNVIAAAVIGGASLSGGRGSAVGAVLGAILVSLIDNAMVILDISQNYNQVVMGSAIVIAVAVDQLKRKYLKG